MENKPRVSRWIGGGYVILTAFIIALYALLMLSIPFTAFYAILILSVVMLAAAILLGIVTYCIWKTNYLIKDGLLSSWSPFAVINVKLRDITNAERTMIPFSFKGFGASAYSGWFFVPTVGWTRVIITNLSDGILIRTKSRKNYLITPSNPDGFIKLLKSR